MRDASAGAPSSFTPDARRRVPVLLGAGAPSSFAYSAKRVGPLTPAPDSPSRLVPHVVIPSAAKRSAKRTISRSRGTCCYPTFSSLIKTGSLAAPAVTPRWRQVLPSELLMYGDALQEVA